jgi:hypothetical protein
MVFEQVVRACSYHVGLFRSAVGDDLELRSRYHRIETYRYNRADLVPDTFAWYSIGTALCLWGFNVDLPTLESSRQSPQLLPPVRLDFLDPALDEWHHRFHSGDCTLPQPPIWGYGMFIVHVAFSMVLVLLIPFTKFAHAIYRIVALYIHVLKPVAESETKLVDAIGAD